MTFCQFVAPPMPYFLDCGEDTYAPGGKHPARKEIGVFDLLLVASGCLYMGEDNNVWEVGPGQTLLLRPDAYHYPARECAETTHFYWLHFRAAEAAGGEGRPPADFVIELEKRIELARPDTACGFWGELFRLEREPHSRSRWQRQLVFHQLLQHLSREQEAERDTQAHRLAERAAAYLRAHYREDVGYERLGRVLNYHAVYISRCMKTVFGCTPQHYLQRYRLEQAKRLLLNTDIAVGRIAEEVGFRHFSYFSKLFLRQEGLTPRMFRSQFR